MSRSKICIMVASHMLYDYPQDPGFLPVHVGHALTDQELAIQKDDEGENISLKNRYFCELTGLYWLWKNVNAEVYGLVHYRRYFQSGKQHKKPAGSQELADLVEHNVIIAAKKRCYFVETVKTHYKNAHYLNDLEVVGGIISQDHPEYYSSYCWLLRQRCLSLFNMFVMNKQDFNAYCTWLFDILFKAEKYIAYQEYGPYQRRVFGFLAERLLNIWLHKHSKRRHVIYLPVINLEGENLFLKATALLKRKLTGKKLK